MKQDVYTATKDNYVTVKARISDLLKDDRVGTQRDSSSTFIKQIELPKIGLPTFSENQLEWKSFRNLSLVHEVSDLVPV